MGLIGLIIAIVVGIGVWRWRIQMLSEVASEAIDAAQTVANLPRKLRFQRSTKGGVIAGIEDPRVGAVVLLYYLAASDGALLERETSLIESLARSRFQLSEEEVVELMIYGRWASGQLTGGKNDIGKLIKKIHQLAPNAGSDLHMMLTAISETAAPDYAETAQAQFKRVYTN